MQENSSLLPRKRFFNAKDIDLFVNYELSRETSTIRRNSVNNVFSFSDKIAQERNSCLKFCFYGMLQSKWSDCENLKIDAYVADTSSNPNAQISLKNPFWVYDRYSGISADTWSFNSRKLDSVNGALCKNIYFKNKASYFFPLEIDLNLLNRTDGFLTNKSIYLSCFDTEKFTTIQEEIPFLFFDEDGVLFEFGEQAAQILENGDVVEINTDHPYLYDRHWVRQELNPKGPPSVYFTNETMTIEEGGLNANLIENKIIPIQVSLSSPSRFGFERVKIEIVFDSDSSGQPLTTIQFPSDALMNTDYLTWSYIGEPQIKYFYLRVQDDYFVEPVEKLTLRLIPILGCVPDLNESQTMTIYFKDNDIPSNVYFQTSSLAFTEPRQNHTPEKIPITLELDRNLLVDGQKLTVYIDRKNSDCKSFYGFNSTNNPGTNYTDSIDYFFNKNDLTYTGDLFFTPKKQNDIQRKITIKMSGLTANLSQRSTTQNSGEAQMVITVDKDLNKTYTKLLIPFDKSEGFGVLRNVYNLPMTQKQYTDVGQTPSSQLSTNMAFPKYSNQGELESGVVPNLPTGNIKEMVYENDFDLKIKNTGDPIVFDGKLIERNEDFTIEIRSGYTSNIGSGEVSYDGSNLSVKLPANGLFASSFLVNFFAPYLNTGLGFWGYVRSAYEIAIENRNFNAKNQNEIGTSDFKTTNLLKSKIYLRYPNTNLAQVISSGESFIYDPSMIFLAGESSTEKTYSLYSRIKNVKSQIQYNENSSQITSYSGNNTTFYPDVLFYKGATIIPKPYIFNNQAGYGEIIKKRTFSTVFFTQDVYIPENELNITGQPTDAYGGVYPVSTSMLTGPISSATKYTTLYFGKLYYQSNVGTISSINGVVQNPPINTLALNVNAPINNIKPWAQAGTSLKSGAMIEIKNEGVIPAVIYGVEIGVGQSLIISETALPPNSNYQNIVRSLDFLNLQLPTNYKYIEKIKLNAGNNVFIKKFTDLRYRITFLNFKITQNQTFNHTITLRKNIIKLGTSGNQVTIPALYLRTTYGPNILVGVPFNNVSVCIATPSYYLKASQSPINKKGAEMAGIVASVASDCPIVNSDFVELSSFSNSNPCSINGLTFILLNTNP